MVDKKLFTVGFAASNPGLMVETEDAVREENPDWTDQQVAKEMRDILKAATLYNDKNKRPSKVKPKEIKKDK